MNVGHAGEMKWVPVVMEAMGGAGAVIFYARFYLQWIASEIQKKSVGPVAFWYMSSIGALMLFTYGIYTVSPVGALSFGFNIVVYSRNLIHIWREQGTLSKRRYWMVHAIVLAVALVAGALILATWILEYHAVKDASPEVFRRTWIWLGIGVVGQGLFACRFAIQWIATETQGKSVIPVAFWYLSLVASVLLAASFWQRAEWIYVVGLATTIPIYARNLWLIRMARDPESLGEVVREDPAAPLPPERNTSAL
ncbi:MAG: lipid-A-disaccharide synthase N-terminal domain-containing protein [Candidatus Hydrogenedentes bacterium]|nr:lipid-A-disaccharide synthase N-terminal domain-containing protein [Candidatus Hydrogenedentota bacterium]